MRRFGFLLLILLGAACGSASAQTPPSASDSAAIREAADLIRDKKSAAALARLSPLTATQSGNPDFDMLYGLALLENGRPAEAVSAFQRVVAARPDQFVARGHLGRALAAAGDLDQARREIEAVRARADLPADIRAVMDNNLKLIDDAIKQRADAARRSQQAAAPQAPSAGPRGTDADGAVIRTAADLVRDKKPDEALRTLEPLAGRLSGNPDFDYVYGVALLDAGRPAQAVAALRRATEKRPDFHVARAELGRALAAMGDLSGAKREFAAVQGATGVPAAARDALGRQVVAIDQAVAAQTGTRVSGYVEQAIGYDTNVNGGPANQQLIIPALSFLGPASIQPGALPKEAGFYELAGAMSIVHPLNNDVALFTNVVGNVHPLSEHHEDFWTALVGGETGAARQFGDLGIVSVAAVGQAFWTGGELFRVIYGVASQWRRRIGEWDTSSSISWLGLEYPNQPGQDADRYTWTGSVGRRYDLPGTPAVSVSINAGKEIARTGSADFLSFAFAGVRTSIETNLNPQAVGFLQAGYEVHWHDADFPLFFEPRHDQLFEVLTGVDVKVSERVNIRPSVRWTHTKSNIDLFDQSRWIGSVATRWSY